MKMKRALAAAGLTVAATVVPLVTAAPAEASAATCRSYLSQWYTVGPGVTAACNLDGPATTAHPVCLTKLVFLGVTQSRAGTACLKASVGN